MSEQLDPQYIYQNENLQQTQYSQQIQQPPPLPQQPQPSVSSLGNLLMELERFLSEQKINNNTTQNVTEIQDVVFSLNKNEEERSIEQQQYISGPENLSPIEQIIRQANNNSQNRYANGIQPTDVATGNTQQAEKMGQPFDFNASNEAIPLQKQQPQQPMFRQPQHMYIPQQAIHQQSQYEQQRPIVDQREIELPSQSFEQEFVLSEEELEGIPIVRVPKQEESSFILCPSEEDKQGFNVYSDNILASASEIESIESRERMVREIIEGYTRTIESSQQNPYNYQTSINNQTAHNKMQNLMQSHMQYDAQRAIYEQNLTISPGQLQCFEDNNYISIPQSNGFPANVQQPANNMTGSGTIGDSAAQQNQYTYYQTTQQVQGPYPEYQQPFYANTSQYMKECQQDTQLTDEVLVKIMQEPLEEPKYNCLYELPQKIQRDNTNATKAANPNRRRKCSRRYTA